MFKKIINIILVLIFIVPGSKLFSQWTSARPDGHAPIGVMGDHTHHKGEVMFSYRFMFMKMDGNRVGTNSVSSNSIVDPAEFGYMVSPLKMDMKMHMFGIMYALSDNVTLMGMLNVNQNSMELITRMGKTFNTESSGFGDINLSGLIVLSRFGNQQVHLNAGVRIPTGSIDEKDATPMSNGTDVQLPYPMQIGSGTFDIAPGITYLGQANCLSWGGQVKGLFRIGENKNGYTLGNKFYSTFWGAVKYSPAISTSLRIELEKLGNVKGMDPSLNPKMVPTANPDLRGGTKINLGIGTNFLIPKGALKNLRFAVEFIVPVYQNLDGPQLKTKWSFVLGTQYAF